MSNQSNINLEALISPIKDLFDQNNDLKKSLQERDYKIKELIGRLESLEIKIDSISSTNKLLFDQNIDLKKFLQERDDTIKELTEQLEAKDDSISSLSGEQQKQLAKIYFRGNTSNLTVQEKLNLLMYSDEIKDDVEIDHLDITLICKIDKYSITHGDFKWNSLIMIKYVTYISEENLLIVLDHSGLLTALNGGNLEFQFSLVSRIFKCYLINQKSLLLLSDDGTLRIIGDTSRKSHSFKTLCPRGVIRKILLVSYTNNYLVTLNQDNHLYLSHINLDTLNLSTISHSGKIPGNITQCIYDSNSKRIFILAPKLMIIKFEDYRFGSNYIYIQELIDIDWESMSLEKNDILVLKNKDQTVKINTYTLNILKDTTQKNVLLGSE